MGWWKSRRLRFLASSVVALFALFVVMRAVFFAFFSEVGDTVHDGQNLRVQLRGRC
mgnify:CR=1 FL=1